MAAPTLTTVALAAVALGFAAIAPATTPATAPPTARIRAAAATAAVAAAPRAGTAPSRAGGGTRTPVALSLGGAHAPVLHLSLRVRRESPRAVLQTAARAGAGAATAEIGGTTDAPAVPDGFLGLSIEYTAVPVYGEAGHRFDQVLANLIPDQRPIIRVGGDSTDHAWIPVRGQHNEGLWDYLGPHWLTELKALTTGAHAHMVMGLNLEVDQRSVPIREARSFTRDLGSSLEAFELGNEPELYSAFPWYHFDGQSAKYTRTSSWSPADYIAEVRTITSALGDVPLWGPSLTATSTWWSALGEIATEIPHLSTITAHAYPTNCYTTPGSVHAPSETNLLLPSSSTGLAAQDASDIAYARATHRAFRIDEINTVSCNGADVLGGFASSLWALEAGFALASAGVSGINLHSYPYARTRLFSFAHQSVSVADEYYGWMVFARAAPPGSHLLSVAVSGNPHVQAFATHSAGSTRMVVLNDSPDHSATVTLSAPGTSLATVEPLRGSGLDVAGWVTFAGLRIASTSGRLTGQPTVAALSGHGSFSVWLPPASADLISLSR